MEIDKWIGGYKVRAFPWTDGERIYFNVQYYAPGQSVEQPPVWDKTVFVTADVAGTILVYHLTQTLVEHVAKMDIKSNIEITLTIPETKEVKSYGGQV